MPAICISPFACLLLPYQTASASYCYYYHNTIKDALYGHKLLIYIYLQFLIFLLCLYFTIVKNLLLRC
jgi:hypothetical protein